MHKRYQVFVSSTYEDLKEERIEVMKALLELDCIPCGMEYFPAASEDQWTYIKQLIIACDYYIVVLGARYGSTDESGVGYTEKEYSFAIDNRIPVIAFIHYDPQSRPAKFAEQTDEGRRKFDAFRERLRKQLCKEWTNPQDLGAVVSRSLTQLIQRVPRVGWVRADTIIEPADSIDSNLLVNEGAFLGQLMQALNEAAGEAWICFIDKSWVFTLAFTLVMCRSRGVNIVALCDSSRMHRRYHLLNLLGCTVVQVPLSQGNLPFSGAVVDSESPLHGKALCLSIKPHYGTFGRVHRCPHDHFVVAACGAFVKSLTTNHLPPTSSSGFRPEVVGAEQEELISRLRNVKFYHGASFQMEEVRLSDTQPIARAVQSAKVSQAHEIIRFFEEQKWNLFRPAAVKLANGRSSLLVPPVLEQWDGSLYVAEGHSRLYALRELGIEKFQAVIVRGVRTPPHASPIAWEEVRKQNDREFIGAPELARHIETVTHADVWSETVAACHDDPTQ